MARKPHKYHYIYKTTCSVTGRYYIGMHSTSNLEDGYIGSGRRLWLSINKHGRKNHSKEILEFLESREALKNKESQLVNEDALNDLMCMNLQLGGGGGLCGEEHKKKFVSAGAKAFANKIKEDAEFKSSFSKKVSENNAKRIKNGFSFSLNWKNRKHKDSTKLKIGMANVENHKGSKNSQYGTMWITTGTENKLIKKTDIVPDGWNPGRKIKNNSLWA